jgi:two-component system, OmpR family, heavy metal sensor histidine kinase CusS
VVEGTFLKNVKSILAGTNSIASQLTLLYTLATFITISIISLFLYWGMVHILYNADRQFVSDEIKIITSILQTKPNNMAALNQEIIGIPHSLQTSVYKYYITVLDQNKKNIAATPGFHFMLNDKEQEQWRTINNHHYFLMQAKVNSLHGFRGSVQVALDVNYQQKIINKYRYNVLLALFVGALFSILLGYLLSKRGMRRLYALTETTKRITANALKERVSDKSLPHELNELTNAYNQMLDRIETGVARLIGFANDLAHELRTPITNLIGEIEIVLGASCSIEHYQRVMESNLEELNYIQQMIENLLFLARAENPQFEVTKELLSINDEIASILRYYQAIADDKKIKVIIQGDAQLLANKIMFQRLISNILSNAFKYSTDDTTIEINTLLISDKVQIIIKDQGIGIAPEHLPYLFERFYRVDVSRTSNTKSLGLGLAIVKSIVDLHEGQINIVSKEALGTSIIIYLPK